MKEKMQAFDDEIFLCHKTHYSMVWTCETGLTTIGETQARARKLRSINPALMTTLVPMKRWYPTFLKQMIARRQVTPRVIMKETQIVQEQRS